MKIAFKFLLSLVLALLLAWGIRTYVFTVYSVPEGGLPPQLKEGNRVIVNRIDCDIFSRGETIVFTDSVECLITPKSKYTGREKEGSYVRGWMEANFIGVIEQMPGDTIRMGRSDTSFLPSAASAAVVRIAASISCARRKEKPLSTSIRLSEKHISCFRQV